jgi:DNA-binding CsgD family transcriptional regulator
MAQTIPPGSAIGLHVHEDKQDRIRAAFAAVLTGAGFKAGRTNDESDFDYTLDVTITLTPRDSLNQSIHFVQIVIIANLLDNKGKVLLAYTINQREGHRTLSAAEDYAVTAAERTIADEYKKVFTDFLSQPEKNNAAEIEKNSVREQLDLTVREEEIFTLLLDGTSPKEIGYKLNISFPTVNFHKKNLYRKLGVQSIHELCIKYDQYKRR